MNTEHSQNAVHHRFDASSFAVVRLEDPREAARLKADLVNCYRPVNAQELFALERMALAQLSILRSHRLEAGLFTSAFNDAFDPYEDRPFQPMDPSLVGDGDIEITRVQNRNYALAEGFRHVAKESNALALMMRFKDQAERQYRRALEDFERLKKLRPELPNHPDLTQPDAPAELMTPKEVNPFIRLEDFADPAAQNDMAQALPPVETQNRPRAAEHRPVPQVEIQQARPVDPPALASTADPAADPDPASHPVRAPRPSAATNAPGSRPNTPGAPPSARQRNAAGPENAKKADPATIEPEAPRFRPPKAA